MFCTKCGVKLSEGARFCTKCGSKVLVEGAIQQTPVEPVAAIPTSPTAQVPQESKIRFLPRKVLGQWMLRKAAIEIGGNKYITRIKRPIDFMIYPGSHNIVAYGASFGKSCMVKITYDFEPGKQYVIRFKSRIFVLLKGKIKIEECAEGAALPRR